MAISNLMGGKYGRLTVIGRAENSSAGKARWQCSCECGAITTVCGSHLISGHTRSCGCLKIENKLVGYRSATHRLSKTRLYRIWANMKSRCENPNDLPSYARYGAKGISVCDAWKDKFEHFRDWAVANGYAENLTIDRINSKENYCPENCRWVTAKTQANNRCSNRVARIGDKVMTITQWCDYLGESSSRASKRLQYGWSVEEALGLIPRKGMSETTREAL